MLFGREQVLRPPFSFLAGEFAVTANDGAAMLQGEDGTVSRLRVKESRDSPTSSQVVLAHHCHDPKQPVTFPP